MATLSLAGARSPVSHNLIGRVQFLRTVDVAVVLVISSVTCPLTARVTMFPAPSAEVSAFDVSRRSSRSEHRSHVRQKLRTGAPVALPTATRGRMRAAAGGLVMLGSAWR